MSTLEWDRLTKITATTAPYRGSTNRFPIVKRTHNTKCFYVEELNGETVYKITNGFDYYREETTEDDYNANKQDVYTDNGGYYRYKRKIKELGIVRSDNTFEFTGDYFSQGDNIVMSGYVSGWFSRSSRHGGMIYKNLYSHPKSAFHPVFKGLRLHLDTMQVHEASHYKLIGRKVSRKNAKEFLKSYEDFYKINETMLKAIDWNNFMASVIDVVKYLEINFDNWCLDEKYVETLSGFFERSRDNAPLDALIAYSVQHNIKEMYYRTRDYVNNNGYYNNRPTDLDKLFMNVKRNLNKTIYKNNPEIMKEIEFEMGKNYPASEWGVTVLVDGKEVSQY